jgi:hypothetical protein
MAVTYILCPDRSIKVSFLSQFPFLSLAAGNCENARCTRKCGHKEKVIDLDTASDITGKPEFVPDALPDSRVFTNSAGTPTASSSTV